MYDTQWDTDRETDKCVFSSLHVLTYNVTAHIYLVIVSSTKGDQHETAKWDGDANIEKSHTCAHTQYVVYKAWALCAECGRYQGNTCWYYTTTGLNQAIQVVKLVLEKCSASLSCALSLVLGKMVAKWTSSNRVPVNLLFCYSIVSLHFFQKVSHGCFDCSFFKKYTSFGNQKQTQLIGSTEFWLMLNGLM